MHVAARCNNREFYFTTLDDFLVLRDHLHQMCRTYEVTLYAYTLMSNHVHLLLQAPPTDALGRPLRWFLTETAKAFHKARGRHGHFWERSYRPPAGCVIAVESCLQQPPLVDCIPTLESLAEKVKRLSLEDGEREGFCVRAKRRRCAE